MRVNRGDDTVPGQQLSAPVHPPDGAQTGRTPPAAGCCAAATLVHVRWLRFRNCCQGKLGIDSGSQAGGGGAPGGAWVALGEGETAAVSWRKESHPGGIPGGRWRINTQSLQEEREVSSSVLSV